MKKDLTRRSVKGSQIIEKNDPNRIFIILIFLFIPLYIMIFAGCGLFYEYPSEVSDHKDDSPAGDENNHIVSEVIDGDTVILENGEHIRLLGINTPEEGMYFYQEAKEVLEIIVLGKEITLEADISDRDMYGRMLRYIFLDNLFVNLEMVKRGFANIYTFPPDVKYAEDFLNAERYARNNNMGLWESSDLNTVSIKIIYDAPGDDNENINGEYVVLKNTGETLLDMSGWTIKDSGTNIYRFSHHDLFPGSEIILFSGKGKDAGGQLYWNSPKPVWNNDFDTLYLRDAEGLLIALYNY